MKKYKVSLAAKVPVNFEAYVRASSEEDAFKKALEKWDDRESAIDATEPDWDNMELDIDYTNGVDALGSGVFIEETSSEIYEIMNNINS